MGEAITETRGIVIRKCAECPFLRHWALDRVPFPIPERFLRDYASPAYVWDYIASGCVLGPDMDEISRGIVEKMIDEYSQADPEFGQWVCTTRITRPKP